MRRMLINVVQWLPGAVTPALLTAASVAPESAATNLAAWWNFITGTSAPNFLAIDVADSVAVWSSLIIFAVWSYWKFGRSAGMKNKSEDQLKSIGFWVEDNVGLEIIDCGSEGSDIGIIARRKKDSIIRNFKAK
jgi:Zn ribbon nucleic-acid-binding protein